jgi:hypothetical protein
LVGNDLTAEARRATSPSADTTGPGSPRRAGACLSLPGIVLVEVEYRGTELCAQLADLEWFQQGDLAGRYRKGDQPVIGDSDDYLSPPPGDVATCCDPLIRWSLPPRRENISTDAEQSGERGNRLLQNPRSAAVPPIPGR